MYSAVICTIHDYYYNITHFDLQMYSFLKICTTLFLILRHDGNYSNSLIIIKKLYTSATDGKFSEKGTSLK